MNESERQGILDQEHIRLLRMGYLFQAGVTLLMCAFGLLYVFLGLFVLPINVPRTPGGPPPEFVGYIMAFMGGLFTIGGAFFATIQFFTARFLSSSAPPNILFGHRGSFLPLDPLWHGTWSLHFLGSRQTNRSHVIRRGYRSTRIDSLSGLRSGDQHFLHACFDSAESLRGGRHRQVADVDVLHAALYQGVNAAGADFFGMDVGREISC